MAESDETRHMNDSTMPPPKPFKPAKNHSAPTSTSSVKQSPSPQTRKKVPALRKGFGLADWNRLVKSSRDLAQTKGLGTQRLFSMDEISQHNTKYDGWIILRGKVYNVSPYLAYHPGGERILQQVLGKDATALYDRYHRWVNQDGLIGKLHIGYLEKSSKSSSQSKSSYLPPSSTSQRTDDNFALPAPPKSQRIRTTASSLLSSQASDEEEDADETMDIF